MLRLHLMAEWWKALSLQRVCFERFHDLASHRGAFSISFETIQHNLKKNDMKTTQQFEHVVQAIRSEKLEHATSQLSIKTYFQRKQLYYL